MPLAWFGHLISQLDPFQKPTGFTMTQLVGTPHLLIVQADKLILWFW
jgi:hypothetical protein